MLAYPKLAKLHTILIRREILRILDNEVKLKKKKIKIKIKRILEQGILQDYYFFLKKGKTTQYTLN